MPVPPSLNRAALEPRGLTLGYALRTGMRRLYMLDGPEIEFEMEGPWRVTRDGLAYDQLALTFVDPSLGGSGYLRRIADEFHLVARQTLEHLDHPGCESACYRCLKSYQNQRFHDRLRWPLVMGDLEALAEAAPQTRPLERGDLDDPGPWAEAFREGLGSPLELRFWRLFEAHGFRPEKQVPISPDGLAEPITVADFAVPGRRLAIYVDGAAFHTGPRLARDRRIRQRLREANPPWRVEELRATDLSQGAALVARLLAE